MEIFFSILCVIFAVFSCIFGVRNRIGNRSYRSTSFRAGSNIRDDRSRYNDLISDYQQLERDEERIQKLDKRDADNIAECIKISGRIRKREPETGVRK